MRIAKYVLPVLLAAAVWPDGGRAAATPDLAPDFSGFWTRTQVAYEKPTSGNGPVMNSLNSNMVWVADITNPILKPETAEILRKNGELEKAWFADLDKPHDAQHPPLENVHTAQQTCWPSGLPTIMTISAAAIEIVQTPKEVAILYERDHFTRFIHMNQAHGKNLPPSWYGDSVGHYEGDTLVVDTIGFNGRSVVDRFGSPSSTALHFVERIRIRPGGRILEDAFTVEDPNVFTMPWSGIGAYRKNNDTTMDEVVCAEGNYDVTKNQDFPIPMQN